MEDAEIYRVVNNNGRGVSLEAYKGLMLHYYEDSHQAKALETEEGLRVLCGSAGAIQTIDGKKDSTKAKIRLSNSFGETNVDELKYIATIGGQLYLKKIKTEEIN